LKPPEVSSSGPPGACITPSNVIIDKTIIFLIVLVLIFNAYTDWFSTTVNVNFLLATWMFALRQL
jgi:hypothetical protein